jgi:pimeloyl-ACP methyl ester carboxylesterase
MDVPVTRFAWNGDVSLAYQIVGEGALDLLYVPGGLSNVDAMWESARYSAFLERLASFSRMIVMDRRGVGCSERYAPSDVAPIEVAVEDIIAVLDDAGSETTALFGFEETNFIVAMSAASYPERFSHLAMLDPSPTWVRDDEITWEWTRREWDKQIELFHESWGRSSMDDTQRHDAVIPSLTGDEREKRWIEKFMRLTQSPGVTAAETRKNCDTDIRGILPSIHLPTLILHRVGDALVDVRSPRYVADHIANARFVEIPGSDHIPFWDHTEELASEIETFLTGVRHAPATDRVLATVLFTDIVGSTERQAAIGDREWKSLVQLHHGIVRSALDRWRGVENDTAGDGFYATFDGPARAINCANEIVDEVRVIGLEVRAGIHTGECERIESKFGGLAVTIGSRVAALGGAFGGARLPDGQGSGCRVWPPLPRRRRA